MEYGSSVTMGCIEAEKAVVSLNVELDASVGPLLGRKAEAAGVIFSGADGDQPGVWHALRCEQNKLFGVDNEGLHPARQQL